MDLQSILGSVIGNSTHDQISEATGASSNDVSKVIAAGLPVILGQLGNNAQTASGATALDQAVAGHATDSHDTVFGQGAQNADGMSILGHIFGSNDTKAANQISKKTGVDAQTVIQILSFVAPLVLAYLGKKKLDQNMSSGDLADSLSKQTTQSGSPLTQIATSILDKNHDGSVLDEVLGGLSSLFGKK